MNPHDSAPSTPREVELAANAVGYAMQQTRYLTLSSDEALDVARHLYDQGLLKMIELPPSYGEDPLFPVVVSQTIERVVWIRACAADEATDIVSEDAEAYFEKGTLQMKAFYQTRSIPPEMVKPS